MNVVAVGNGDLVSLENPRREDFVPGEIARSLAGINRFCRHGKFKYSVAQHSVLLSRAVRVHDALAALLHDVEETLTGDMTAPWKAVVMRYGGRVLDRAAAPIRRAIAARFGLEWDDDKLRFWSDAVDEADKRIVLDEGFALFGNEYVRKWPQFGKVKPLGIVVEPWTEEQAEIRWMARYVELRRRLPV